MWEGFSLSAYQMILEEICPPKLRYAFTDALGPRGDRNFSLALNGAFDDTVILQNRQALAAQLGVEAQRFIFMRQEHTANIQWIDEALAGRGSQSQAEGIPSTDALITQTKGITLLAQTGDCQPVLLYDPSTRTIAAIHAGWRGTAQRIVPKTLLRMQELAGVSPQNVHALLGPCIGANAFEVEGDVASLFRELPVRDVVLPHPLKGKFYIDIPGTNRQLLESVGVPTEHIRGFNDCTYSLHPQYFSARKGDWGRQVGAIVLL